MIPLLALLALAIDCHPVAGDRVLGRDLAAASPAFASIDPQAVIASAPIPGARRIFSAAELVGIARTHHIAADGLDSLCLERESAPLDPDKVIAAMRKSLGLADLDVQIVELSRFPVATGELVFPRELLPPPGPDGAGIWKGYVSYAGGRQTVWANVRLSTTVRRVVAVADILAGRPLTAQDVRLEELRDFPTRALPLTDPAQAVGKVARRALRSGATLFAADLTEPYFVERGQSVTVEVHSGAAMLTLEATAEAAGRRGETIPLRNRDSGKIFRGQVSDKGRVVLAIPTEGEGPK